jgi:hypothetical protein
MAEMPRAKDLFGDVSPVESAKRMEEYTDTLGKALSNASAVPGQAPAKNPVDVIEGLVANKSLAPEAVSALNQALASQRTAMGDVVKDISLTSPLSTSFAAFDLEAPAKLLTPRPTPLRNRIPRKRGVGTSHRVKRILGYTGTGTGGVGNLWPGITETTTNTFGAINYERGPKISYAADDLVLPYNSYSLSDSVTFDANFSGLGYQDLRQLSSTSTLYATMLMEERMMLMSRGTASGYSGLLSAPASLTTAVTAAGVGQTAITGVSGGKIYVTATSDAGAFGQSGFVTLSGAITVTSGDVVTVTIPPVVGAIGYNIYVGTGASAPANSAVFYAGRTATNTFVIQGALPTTGVTVAGVAADQAAGSNLSAYATGYDGILPTVLGPNSGAVNNVNAVFSTSNPGVEFQDVFVQLYNNVKADPDMVLLNGADRKQLSDAIKSGSVANYRLTIDNPGEGGTTYGSIVTGLQNEVTGKAVELMVHPWLPQGVAPVLSFTLPIPDTEVSDVWANFLVQDYMGIQWPVTQFSYDFSTYFRGTFFCTAPAWNGAVSGIKAA